MARADDAHPRRHPDQQRGDAQEGRERLRPPSHVRVPARHVRLPGRRAPFGLRIHLFREGAQVEDGDLLRVGPQLPARLLVRSHLHPDHALRQPHRPLRGMDGRHCPHRRRRRAGRGARRAEHQARGLDHEDDRDDGRHRAHHRPQRRLHERPRHDANHHWGSRRRRLRLQLQRQRQLIAAAAERGRRGDLAMSRYEAGEGTCAEEGSGVGQLERARGRAARQSSACRAGPRELSKHDGRPSGHLLGVRRRGDKESCACRASPQKTAQAQALRGEPVRRLQSTVYARGV
mmetsp:Transcript_238/g.379  ORF Transcript_238/g.379 Transcript_238/m.379 type:complete len:289 (-) Transcript_238:172-1038(-)